MSRPVDPKTIKRIAAALVGLLLLLAVPEPALASQPQTAAPAAGLSAELALPVAPCPLGHSPVQLQSLSGTFVLSGGPHAEALELTYSAILVFGAGEAAAATAAIPGELIAAHSSVALEDIVVTLNGRAVILEPADSTGSPPAVLPGGCAAGKWQAFRLALAQGEQAEVTLSYRLRAHGAGMAAVRAYLSGLKEWDQGILDAALAFEAPGFDPWHFNHLYPASLFRLSGLDEWTWEQSDFEPSYDVLISADAQSWAEDHLATLPPAEAEARLALRESFLQADRLAGDRLALWPLYEQTRSLLSTPDPQGEQAVLSRYILARLSAPDAPGPDEPRWEEVSAAAGARGGWRVRASLLDPDADLTGWELVVFTGNAATRRELFRRSGAAEEFSLCGQILLDETMDLPRAGGMQLELTAYDAAGHVVRAEPLELTRSGSAGTVFWWLATAGLAGLAFRLRGRVRRTAARRA